MFYLHQHRLKTGRCDLSHRLNVAQWRLLACRALVPSVCTLRMKIVVSGCWNWIKLTTGVSISPRIVRLADC